MIPDDANDYKQWAIGEAPASLWVEGSSSAGFLSGEDGLRLYYSPHEGSYPGAEYNPDLVSVTIVEVNMDMDGVDDDEEESVGGYVPLGGVKRVVLNRVKPVGDPPGQPPGGVPLDGSHRMTLDLVDGDASKIRIWDNAERTGTPWTLPLNFSSGVTWPYEVWIEGVEASDSVRDLTLGWEYTIGGRTIEDRIKLTVYEVEHVYPNDTTKVMISTLHDDTYPSGYQEEDGKIRVVAQIRPVIEGMEVYFTMQYPDPEDGSPYDDPDEDDDNTTNAGWVWPASPVPTYTNSAGEAECVLNIATPTLAHAGDNFIVEASGSSAFEEFEESGLLVAWKRYYIEEDKMYRIGSDLAADFTNDGDSDNDVISVINGGVFSVDDEIDVFDADNSETRTIIAISGNDITVADLTNSYNAGYESGDKGAAVGKNSESGGFYEADIEALVTDAFGSDSDGEDGGCFTEFKILEVDENTVNKVPYRLAMGELFWANEDYRDVWFKNKGEQDYFWVCGAARLDADYTTDYGQTYHAYNTSYVFVENIEWYEPSFYEAQVIADTTAHEIGHQFAFDAGEVDGYHELVWCHEGSESDRCLMASNCSQYDDYSEFCYDGDNHLMEVRSFVDQ